MSRTMRKAFHPPAKRVRGGMLSLACVLLTLNLLRSNDSPAVLPPTSPPSPEALAAYMAAAQKYSHAQAHKLNGTGTLKAAPLVDARLAAPTERESREARGAQAETRFCDTRRPCVFDVGFNTGQDTRYYLESPATHVVAVEANPVLVRRLSGASPFAEAIGAGRLRLLPVGITSAKDIGQLKFYVNEHDAYSSFIERVGCRRFGHGLMPVGDRTYCREIEVPTTTCRDLVGEYGTPDYMKIDIEGLHLACVWSLEPLPAEEKPKYISIEGTEKRGVEMLARLGYGGFKLVNQKEIQGAGTDGFSGPWGEDAVDWFVGADWQTAAELLGRLPLQIPESAVGGRMWFDIHAKMM